MWLSEDGYSYVELSENTFTRYLWLLNPTKISLYTDTDEDGGGGGEATTFGRFNIKKCKSPQS